MALTFTGTNGLFTRLGKIFRQPWLWAPNQAAVQANYNQIVAAYASPDLTVPASIPGAVLPARQGIGATWQTLQTTAANTVIQMVMDDNPAQAGTLTSALNEVIRQMNNQSATVATCVVGCTAAAIPSITNHGNGAIVINTIRGDGQTIANIVAEVGNIVVTADSQTGNQVVGNETWQYVGAADNQQPLLMDVWPTGSGANVTVTGVSPFVSASGGNVLTNTDFENWSGSPVSLNNWTMTTGTFGTNIIKNTTAADVFTGSVSAKFVGDGSSTFGMQQQIGNSAGTIGTVLPNKSYSFNFFALFDTPPAAGVLTVDLYNGTSVVQDDAGNNNSVAFTLSAFTSSFAAYGGTFRMPAVLPANLYLRIRVTTAISNSSNLYMDTLAFGATTPLYPGGPGVTIFPGSKPWIAGDGFKLTSTNDRGGGVDGSTTYNGTFQAMFDAFFGMRALGLLLPAAGLTADEQTVSCNYTPTGGTFTLTITLPDGSTVTTATIVYDATALQVANAINTALGFTGVTAHSGGSLPGTAVVITFGNQLAGLVPVMTVNYSALTGGTPGNMSVAHTDTGVPTIPDGLLTIAT